MRKTIFLAGAVALALSYQSAQAIPVPGMNTVETKCISYYSYPVDYIKEPGNYPSAHTHVHYGIAPDQNHNARTEADESQRHTDQAHIQNIPGGGRSNIVDPGYNPVSASCLSYGEWAWYAIPNPLWNGMSGDGNRSWTWLDPNVPRVVSVMTLTWAGPIGQAVYEPPFGATYIVGNAHAMSEDEQDNEHVYWTCGDLVTKSRKPRDCSGGLPPPPPPVNPLPGLYEDYRMKAEATAAQQAVVEAAIAANDYNATLSAVTVLRMRVDALRTSVAALETAAAAALVPPPMASTPPPEGVTEWTHGASVVTAVIVFPDCWDGQKSYDPNAPDKGFDTPGGIGRQHFYYSTNGSCGSGVRTTQLFMSVRFLDWDTHKPMVNPYNADGSLKLSFASGPYYTMHADFGNEWNIGLGYMTAGCLNKQDSYGGFAPLNNWTNSCNAGGDALPRCPAVSTGGFSAFAPNNVAPCKDQD